MFIDNQVIMNQKIVIPGSVYLHEHWGYYHEPIGCHPEPVEGRIVGIVA